MALTQPVADLKLSFAIDSSSFQTIVDLVLTPGGDLQLVAGTDRLAQDVVRWLLVPQGANAFDPAYGNPLYSLLSRPSSGDPQHADVLAMVTQAQSDFLVRQETEIRAGQRSPDEAVLAFTNLQVAAGNPSTDPTLVPAGSLAISFDIVTQAGVLTGVTIPLISGVAAPPPPPGLWDTGVWDGFVWS